MGLEPSFRELLPRLEAEGLVEASAVEGALAAQAGATPWFVRMLVGLGAWVSAAFLVAFVGAAVFQMEDTALLVLGLVGCAGAILLRRSSEGVFTGQLALALGLAGQGLFIGSLSDLTDSARWGTAATVAIASLMLALYPDRVQAFLSAASGVLAALFLVRELRLPLAADGALLLLAALTHAVLLDKVRLLRGALGLRAQATAAGLVTALLLALLLRSQADAYRALFDAAPHPARSALLTAGLSLLLLLTVASALRESEVVQPRGAPGVAQPAPALDAAQQRRTLQAAALAVVPFALLTWQTPGLIGAASVMGLAFHRRSPVLLGLAVVFALLAGSAHYYDLSLTLLHKSAALAGGGLLLLGLRLWVLRRFPEEAR
jgi:hypothetical protein